ncbi:flagellar hook-length control protein FliK [Mitsuaria sp. GD03876]|uniref:flagellar hook-length control protein FliK n=1 Tax=Mitsuaria sp. GD03876 TaxID=2975399 RepID=UPI00244CEC25|nr:flagellar hook-length control protein FliK [Mitsuaria sp. GD03876]MDH0865118.1 flagellar hook-length control protein FliK [Mitsuaria sp. GD03876]
MTQIQNNAQLPGALAGLGANNPAYTGRKEGSPDFARWLNQSSQQLQTQSTQAQQASQLQTQQLAAQQLQTQQQAQQLQAQQQAQRQNAAQAPKPPKAPENTSAQEENKLAARNAAARRGAAPAEDAKAPAQAVKADAADQPDAADAAEPVDAKDPAAADAEGAQAGERVEAKDGEGKDRKVAKDAKDGAATPAEQILAMLRGEAPPEAKGPARAGSADGEAAGTDALPGGAQAHGKHPTTGDAMRERQELQRELSQAAAGKAGAAEGADKAAAQETLQAVSGGAHEIAAGDGAAKGPQPSFDALLAAAQQAGSTSATGSADAAAPAPAPSVPLSQPLTSPDFAPELSASVSLLIQDGVHEAQLQLNPTEMGPVSINIQLDGQQAQVNFHAQHAATREVLERSLPDLAAALQAQGLTLSGGGVFAQTQSNGGQNRGDGSSEGTANGRPGRGRRGQDDDGAIAAAGRAERRTAPRGLVDLYA